MSGQCYWSFSSLLYIPRRLLSTMSAQSVRRKSSDQSPDYDFDMEPNDSSYFGSYGHFEIHGEMISKLIITLALWCFFPKGFKDNWS